MSHPLITLASTASHEILCAVVASAVEANARVSSFLKREEIKTLKQQIEPWIPESPLSGLKNDKWDEITVLF